jgi:ABC-type sugar transport system ATPase subunit
LKAGECIQQGAPEQVYRQPVNEYSAGLFGEYNLLNAVDAGLLMPTVSISNQKKLLVRPEQFIVTGAGGLQGIVANISFMGSYYIIDVIAGSQTLKIKTGDNTFAAGQTVQLSLSSGTPWYI